MTGFSQDQVNHFIIKKHHLTNDTKIDDIVKITKDIFGLHATVATSPYLSLYSRSNNFSRDNLLEALVVKKTLGKIRCIRKTIHIVPKEMIPIVFSATKKEIELNSERYYKYLGITENDYEKVSKETLKIIKGHGLSAKEIKSELNVSMNISPIINLMCDKGLLIRGPPRKGWKSNTHVYYNFHEHFPDLKLDIVDEYSARNILIKNYISNYGPVTTRDIAWWTGFPMSHVRKQIDELDSEIIHLKINGSNHDYILFKNDISELKNIKKFSQPVINFLPDLDPYIMGYKIRDRYVNKEKTNMIFDRAGNSAKTINLNGYTIGIWDHIDPYVKIFLLQKVEKTILEKINEKAIDIGKFISGKKVKIKICKSMTPLTERTAGSVLSPLKEF